MSRSLSRVAGVIGELLVAAGVLVALFVVWQFWWTDVESDRAQAASVSSLSAQFATVSEPADDTAPVGHPADATAIVRIPRLGADWARPLVEGTTADDLARGLGHYVGTAEPGSIGNFAVAGHRTTYGKPLADIDRLRDGDRIVVETVKGWTVYAVSSHSIVLPSQGEVIAPVPGDVSRAAKPTEAVMTLTACHPRYSAKQRYIVHAELVETRPRASGAPSLDVAVTSAAGVS
ncbi:sortase [Knoellia sinensis KCTC 19936]|uniref:Sortase n=1 Tax=Knoellia sinensis KCTC 19936 TaxID=1385520 RepID=A0A0A0J032_9MICO|nr:class E sortase [Knoellia sinensis]KGN30079.1 sortase [Knoellia sinensis KCTC 19936]